MDRPSWRSRIVSDFEALSPEQRRQGRQICFWFLLVYLEVDNFEWAGALLMIPAAVVGVVARLGPETWIGQRPSFVAIHASFFSAMIFVLLHSGSWIVWADVAVLGLLVALELQHRRAALLLLIAAEHLAGLLSNPWSAIPLRDHPGIPGVGAYALLRVAAIIMLLASWFRVFIVPRFAPPPSPPPPPKEISRSRPLTVAQWEARHPPRD
ncbi:MAG: hypothetical protein JOZ54_08545 [Acidobacteria bacterium]|nr:hypothetical protein [Acidobacteriota bacterium]